MKQLMIDLYLYYRANTVTHAYQNLIKNKGVASTNFRTDNNDDANGQQENNISPPLEEET